MNITAIIFAAVVVGGVGILIGFFLGVSGEKFDQFTGFLKAQKEKMQAFAKQAVFPEGVCLDSADQA